MTFSCMIHTYFALKKLFFHKIFIFNTLLPKISKNVYTKVAGVLEISKLYVQFWICLKFQSLFTESFEVTSEFNNFKIIYM
jgi:hypothetical protein